MFDESLMICFLLFSSLFHICFDICVELAVFVIPPARYFILNGAALSKVYIYDMNTNPHIFAMKIPDTQIPDTQKCQY